LLRTTRLSGNVYAIERYSNLAMSKKQHKTNDYRPPAENPRRTFASMQPRAREKPIHSWVGCAISAPGSSNPGRAGAQNAPLRRISKSLRWHAETEQYSFLRFECARSLLIDRDAAGAHVFEEPVDVRGGSARIADGAYHATASVNLAIGGLERVIVRYRERGHGDD